MDFESLSLIWIGVPLFLLFGAAHCGICFVRRNGLRKALRAVAFLPIVVAAGYILLAAEDLGIGACWNQIRDRDGQRLSASDEIKAILGIPSQYEVLCVIALGHKGENKEKTDGKNGIWHWGVRCYSSADLYNWKDEGIIIPPEPEDPASSLHPSACMDRTISTFFRQFSASSRM